MQLTRLQIAGTLALGVLLAASLAWASRVSPAISFVRQDEAAPWIASPEPVSMGAVAAPFARLPAVEFSKRFRSAAAVTPLRVRVEALRGFELELNGRAIAARAWNAGSWRRAQEIEIADGVVVGENVLRVRVRNPSGPPLLRLVAEGAGLRFATDPSWSTRREGAAELPARRADDRVRAAAAIPTPRRFEGLLAKRDALVFAFAGAALLSLALRTRAGGGVRARLPGLVFVAIAVFWIHVFVRAVGLPEYVGFDGPDHLVYVQHILARGSLPLASEAAQGHHPPLFYALSAALLGLLEGPGLPARVVLRLVPFASGLAQIGVAFALARRLQPSDRLVPAATALCAALLPVNLYMSAYLGNEPLHAAFAGLALLVATQILLATQVRAARLALLGVLLGLAILSKVSSLLLVPLAVGFVAAKQRWIDGRALAPTLARSALCVASAAAVCGWFFVRNQLRLGQALVGNWNLPGNPVAWWQHPGFHTPAYYLSFGTSLRQPFFASFESFWDGLYSTFWGDGLAGGVSAWAYRHSTWDWDFMGATYVLALPATALLVFGFGRLVFEAFHGDDPRRRTALSFLVTAMVVSVFAVLYMTLVLPAYSMTKASYALSMAAPCCLALAVGFASVHRALEARGWRALQVIFHGWAGALASAIALSFAG